MPRYPVFEKEHRFLSHDEIKTLLAVSKSLKMHPIIASAIYTGMRLGELQNLTWEDIDFKHNMITVQKSKSKKFRKIPLHTGLRKILYPLNGSGPCFDTNGFYWQIFHLRKKLKKAKLKRFRFHDLRHTFASMMIKSGVDILTVSKLLGHSSVVVTQIYAHLYQDHIKDAMKKLRI
jgi:integrase